MKKRVYFWLGMILFFAVIYTEVTDERSLFPSANSKEIGCIGGILIHRNGYISCVDVETYIKGCLGTTIDLSASEPVIQAQAVLLRSSIYYCREVSGDIFLDEKEVGFCYLSREQWRERWGDDFDKQYEKITRATEDTKGIVLCYRKRPIVGSYCRMSPGKTQPAGGQFPYFKQVLCENNIKNETYQMTYRFHVQDEIVIGDTDEDGRIGYVFEKGQQKDAYSFAKEHGLNGPFLYKGYDRRTIVVNGIGHGCGMDQTYADALCRLGQTDFMALLKTFYQNVTFEKVSW